MKIKIKDVLSVINCSNTYDEARILLDLTYGISPEDVYDQVSKAHDIKNIPKFKSILISDIKSFDQYKYELNYMCCLNDLEDLVAGRIVLTNFFIEI